MIGANLCRTYDYDTSKLVDMWSAYSLNHKIDETPTSDAIEDLQRDVGC